MIDMKLNDDGDIDVQSGGDILVVNNVKQAILIRLRWISQEWRLGPDFGFPWFDEIFVKNPNITKIKQLIREELLGVEGVTQADVTDVQFDRKARTATFRFSCIAGNETITEEVSLNG